jgi:hypothetical protein
MTRRFLFPLAASVVGLVAISPVLAAEQSTPAAYKTPAKSPAKATTTTMADDHPAAPDDDSGATTDDSSQGSSNSTATTGKGSSNAPPSTGSGSGGQRSTSVCDPPETEQGPAPQAGDAPQTHNAGEAGSVDVERLSAAELRVVKATPNDGWTEQVATPSGPRVTVKFTRQGQSPSLIRFAASMDQKGTMIHVRVTSCG